MFASADANIKKGQKRQKKNYDLRNERPVKIYVGYVVLKEKQKDISHKVANCMTDINTLTYTVIKIMQNGNAVLHSNKSNEVLITPCPLKHLRSMLRGEVETPTTSTSMTNITAGTPNIMTTRTIPGTDASMDATKEHIPPKKRLCFKFDTTSSMTTSMTSSSAASSTYSMTEINNGLDDLEFMDDILDVISENCITR